MPDIAFQLNNLCVTLPGSLDSARQIPVLNNISLNIEVGEQIAIIGPSGAGKTTLLEVLALARQPATGHMALFGQNPWHLTDYTRHALRTRLFLAPQQPPLPPRQRVVTTVLAGLLPQWTLWQSLSSLIYPQKSALAYAALEPFDMQDKLFSRVDRLSGGERQRVSLARMLASNAEAMLVDEPLSALDPTLAASVLAALQQAAAHRHATLICSLHQAELACRVFPRIIGLRDGQIVFDLPQAKVTPGLLAALYEQERLATRQCNVETDGSSAAALIPRDGTIC